VNSGNHTSFGSTSSSIDKHKVDIDFLDKYGTEQWEVKRKKKKKKKKKKIYIYIYMKNNHIIHHKQ